MTAMSYDVSSERIHGVCCCFLINKECVFQIFFHRSWYYWFCRNWNMGSCLLNLLWHFL